MFGIPGVDFVGPLPRSTSPGYTWLCKNRGGKGKTKFIPEDCEHMLHEGLSELRKAVEHRIAQAQKGIREPAYFMDMLKDETRPYEKVIAGKTRAIFPADMDYVVAVRMYFGDFHRWYMQNRIRNGSAVGINPYSREWDQLCEHAGHDSVLDADYRGYDKRLNMRLQYSYLIFANRFYNDGNDAVRHILFQESVESFHIYGEDLYSWFGSNPSGSPFTTILNTITNKVNLRYAFICSKMENCRMDGDPDYGLVTRNLMWYEDNVIDYAYGDDIAFFCRDPDNIDFAAMASAMLEYGMEITPGDKVSSEWIWRPRSEISFLKRGMVKRGNKWFAPLAMDVIKSMGYWIDPKISRRERVNILQTLLMELALHGEEVYLRDSPEIIRGMASVGYSVPVTSWPALIAMADSRDEYY